MVLNQSELQRGAILLPELLVLLGINFLEHLKSLADKLLLDDLQQLVLLEGLAGHVQRQVVRVNNTAEELQILGNKVIELIYLET